MMAKRVFLIVLDSFGIGAAADASDFGDLGASTFKSVYATERAEIKNLLRMGLGNIDGIDFTEGVLSPIASYGRLCEASKGKDTTIGHWEITGHISNEPLPTFQNGFPESFLKEFSKKVGRGILCNKPYSGTAVIDDYGDEHMKSGDLIVYTSADSVFQIAAHTSVVPLEELYKICETAREMLCGELGVGRVIARPFAGDAPNFYRTADRRDYSLEPPVRMLPDGVKESGLDSIAVGKIADIFAGRGFTEIIRTHSNAEGMSVTSELVKKDFSGLCFVNLVDFDTLWGHRRDPVGYAEGLSEFDTWLGGFLPMLGCDDILIITADHGCDPCFKATTDHTREDVPLMVYSQKYLPTNIGVRNSFADIAATVAQILGICLETDGQPISLMRREGGRNE